MNNEQTRIESLSDWYLNDQLDIDKLLIYYRYQSFKDVISGNHGLELGPAEGHMTQYLKSHFKTLTVVEGAKKLIDRIPDYENVKKVHSLFEDYQPDQKFDFIIIDHILEHVEDPIKVLSNAMKWLATNGTMVLGVPNANSLHRLVAVKMKLLSHQCQLNERDVKVGHRRVYTPETFRADIDKSGLVLSELRGVFLKPISNGQIQQMWDKNLIEGFYQLGKDFPEICAEMLAIIKT